MSRDARENYHRLAIVSVHGEPLTPKRTFWRWPCQADPEAGCYSELKPAAQTATNMTVMPKLSRHRAGSIFSVIWTLVRGYFSSEPATRGRVVLAFRRQGFAAPLARPTFPEEGFGKKANGSVHWTTNHAGITQEEGRG